MRSQPRWPLKKGDRAGNSQASLEVRDSGLLLRSSHRLLHGGRRSQAPPCKQKTTSTTYRQS
eukprot:1428407-Amphidinium_carterae.1